MKSKLFNVLILLCLFSFTSCSQSTAMDDKECVKECSKKNEKKKTEPHRYGGWYCPDNLNGFPAVDIANWKNVPVIKDRMPTKEETQNGKSLIFVEAEKYPTAQVIDLSLPRLARVYNQSTNRKELIIVIQAFHIDNDSIIGFRYLNGGNGSSRLNEVKLLSDSEISKIAKERFVTYEIEINATQETIWKVLTQPENAKLLQPTFAEGNKLNKDWRGKSNVNFQYAKSGKPTAKFAQLHYGCYYVQNDYVGYTDKFLLLEDVETKITELKITCGPYTNDKDYNAQKIILTNWALKAKELSEMKR